MMDVTRTHAWTALAGLVAAAAVFGAGYWAGVASAAAPSAAGPTVTLPDWFLPIWDAYDRNPAVTQQFDFASLYSGDIGTSGAGTR